MRLFIIFLFLFILTGCVDRGFLRYYSVAPVGASEKTSQIHDLLYEIDDFFHRRGYSADTPLTDYPVLWHRYGTNYPGITLYFRPETHSTLILAQVWHHHLL